MRSKPQTFFAPGRRHARPRDAASSFNSLLRGMRTRFPRQAAHLLARARFPQLKEDENTFGSHAGGAAKTTASAFRRRTRSLHGRGPATCGTLPFTGHWETTRIAAIGPRAARYGRSRPLLTLAPFTALRTRARVEKEYLPTHPWAIGKTPARALPKWRATGVNQFADMANAVWRPSRKGLASRLAALARGARKSEPRARGIK